MKKIIYISCFSLTFFLCSIFVNAQSGILLNTEEATKSYTFLQNGFNGSAYLIDNCGEVVQHWSNVSGTNLHPKMLPDGNIIYIKSNSIFEHSWDGTIINSINNTDNTLLLEYEVIKLPNGNYLCLGRRNLDFNGFIDLGFDMSTSSPNVTDVVVEYDAQTGELVWEWNIADHVIQERDESVGNYGVVADHPELFDMDAISQYDWDSYESFMINGMDYNAELDQIVLSVRKMSELVVIDHSTTTAEAAGHSGGTYGKGGDALYRWGNPQNYGQGTATDQFLFYQHNPTWIKEGTHAEKLTCYNNGLNRPGVPFGDEYSDIPIISTPVDSDGNYPLNVGEAYLPVNPDIVYNESNMGYKFYSGYTSGVAVLPNGNVFITEGVDGRTFEINAAGETVWRYTLPNATSSFIFRTEKYPLDYPAFVGKDLTPNGSLPSTTSNYVCELVDVGTYEYEAISNSFVISYLDNKNITVKNTTDSPFTYKLFNTLGHEIMQGQSNTAIKQLSLTTFPPGLYILGTSENNNDTWTTHKVLLR